MMQNLGIESRQRLDKPEGVLIVRRVVRFTNCAHFFKPTS